MRHRASGAWGQESLRTTAYEYLHLAERLVRGCRVPEVVAHRTPVSEPDNLAFGLKFYDVTIHGSAFEPLNALCDRDLSFRSHLRIGIPGCPTTLIARSSASMVPSPCAKVFQSDRVLSPLSEVCISRIPRSAS
jgi:hypothetical protein